MGSLESINNPYIKTLYSLHEKKFRDIEKKFLVEGEHLVKEAYITNNLEVVLYSDEKYKLDGVENIHVSQNIIQKLAFTKSPQNVIGVCKYLDTKNKDATKFLLLDDIQDPGNLGTLVRSSLGFNIDKIYLSKTSVDLYNDKFIRSSQGAIFHIDIEVVDLQDQVVVLKDKGIDVFGTSLDGGVSIEEIKIPNKYAIILGNEGNGIKKDILSMTTKNIYITTNPLLESLNVSIAGSIILYYFDKHKKS